MHHLYEDYFLPSVALTFYAARWFVGCLIGFSAVTWLLGAKKQKLLRPDMGVDMVYWFYAPLLYRPLGMALNVLFLSWLSLDVSARLQKEGLSPLNTLPLWAQVVLIILVSDFLQYWVHRMFHMSQKMWPYHAVHHSSTTLDWLSAARFHPVNILLYSLVTNNIVMLLGFSPEAFLVLIPFNTLYSSFVHMPLNWKLGPLRYVIVSPVYHRWHHTSPDEGGDRNFAQTLPVMDLLFGTFYLPEGRYPENFGVKDNPVPEDFIGQMAYPFRLKAPVEPSVRAAHQQ